MSKAKKINTKYVFKITGLNLTEIDTKYGFDHIINDNSSLTVPNTTNISDISDNSYSNIISFLDESKRVHTCNISMIDFKTGKEPVDMGYECYWCRYKFSPPGIGCPIKYIHSQAVKKYYSEISKDVYTIKGNITSSKSATIADDKITVAKGEYYETDGIFCSFNCCKSWIDDNKHSRLYDQSNYLLLKLYNDVMGTRSEVITPAPHWRLREESGGPYTEELFKDKFKKMEYDYHGTYMPEYKPIGMLYEERIRF